MTTRRILAAHGSHDGPLPMSWIRFALVAAGRLGLDRARAAAGGRRPGVQPRPRSSVVRCVSSLVTVRAQR